MEHLFSVLEFAGKGFIVLVVTLFILAFAFYLASKAQKKKDHLELEKLNERFEDYKWMLRHSILSKKELKALLKQKKKDDKKEEKKDQGDVLKPRLYVLNFEGDVRASAVDTLREEISALLTVGTDKDEVLVKVDSPGGMVHTYGLAASQLLRLRQAMRLTISVDKVAASGGYMMACTGHEIIAAPFAIVGSIGVIAQVPNFNRLLKKNEIDYEELTSGEFKRTVSMFGNITEQGRKKFLEQLEDTHKEFKNFIRANRPNVEIDKVSTGEHWLAAQAKDLGLVDQIMTSDEYIMNKAESHDIYSLKFMTPKKWRDVLDSAVQAIPWFRMFNPKSDHNPYDKTLFL